MSATKIDNRKMGRKMVEVVAFIDLYTINKLADLALKFGRHSPWSFQYL